jgi:hypothetical protein
MKMSPVHVVQFVLAVLNLGALAVAKQFPEYPIAVSVALLVAAVANIALLNLGLLSGSMAKAGDTQTLTATLKQTVTTPKDGAP